MSAYAAPRTLVVLLPLFFASGCAALIYEIVWFQLLQLVIGSSAVSLAVLLGTFMGGMCLGSLWLPRLVSGARHPLRVYAVLECAIAVTAVAVLLAVPVLGRFYTAMVGHGWPGIALRAVVCALCLLPPTVLMGATLPAIARFVETTPRGIAWLGFFYAGNTAGAVAGCLIAGFYLLRCYDTTTATLCAVALNLLVAVAAVAIARRAPFERAAVPPSDPDDASPPPARSADRLLFAVLAASGFCALAAEVVWTRLLSLLLGATVYTFSIILAVFLAGLGIGSTAGAELARLVARPRWALAACQGLQIAAIAWAAQTIAITLPQWPGAAAMPGLSAKFQYDLFRSAWAILPSALLWGASFPLALASLSARARADGGTAVGRSYAANTVGAIAGALAAALWLIPGVGTRLTQVVLIVISGAGAWLLLAPRRSFMLAVAAVVIGAGTIAAIRAIPATPWQLIAYGRAVGTTDFGAQPLFVGEGMNSSVAVSEMEGGARFFHVSGKTEASSLVKDMRLQRMLGHLPALLHARPRSVLIVGCGAGVTAGTFVLHPSIERVVICDIEPLIPRVVADHFRAENHDVIRDPRVEIVYDDARHYIATTREKFDLITSDPIHPWVKGAAVLYSEEYFRLCRERLNPGGLISQWVPLYESDRAVVQSEIATFLSVFPHGTIWANDDDGYGYDTVMLGQALPLEIDVENLQARFDRGDHLAIRAALAGLGFGSAIELLATYAGRASDLGAWLANAEINRDGNLRLQYLAGLRLDSTAGADAYLEILDRRRFPTDLFRAAPARLQALEQALQRR